MKNNRNKKKGAAERNRTDSAFFEISRKGMAQNPKKTAQSCIPILEWYENGILHIAQDPEMRKKAGNKENELYCLVCSFTGSGYLSGTEAEKARKYHAYREALSSLPTYLHYEEIVANRPVDAQTYLRAVASSKGEGRYSSAFFAVQRKFVEGIDREISLKRYLLVLSTYAPEGELPVNRLLDGLTLLQGKFREFGSSLDALPPAKVFAELFRFLNPLEGEMPPIPADLYRRGLRVQDLLSPDGIEFGRDFLRLGSAYVRIFSITSYGKEIMDTVSYALLNHNLPVTLCKHIDHIDKETAIRAVKRQLDELESRRQSRMAKNKTAGTSYIPMDLERAIEGCNQLLEELSNGEEFLYQTVYLSVCAESAEQLEDGCNRLKSAALSVHCRLRTARFLQEKAFQSALPLGRNLLPLHQMLLSGEAAIMTPFSYESRFDPGGFWYGRLEHSGEPMILNRKLGKSSHGFVFGLSGSGKGFWVKNEITNILFQPFTREDEVLAVDATGEYLPLCKAVQGRVVEITPNGGAHLNPLYISEAQQRAIGREQARASKIEHLIALLSQIKTGEGLTATEKSLVDAAAGRCFEKKRPTLETFFAELEKEGRRRPGLASGAEEMRNWLSRYVTGSVTLFAGEDTEEKSGSERMTVYSVRGLTGDLRSAGMLAMLERIETRVIENHAAGRWTWIYIDEMHRYFDAERNPYAAARFSRFYAEMRHYGAILTGITQLPKPVVDSKDGASMLSNSRFVVMAELDGSNIAAVTGLYDLNEDQQRTLASAGIGQYIVRMGGAPASVRMLYPGGGEGEKNLMYDLFNTRFEDKEDGKEDVEEKK